MPRVANRLQCNTCLLNHGSCLLAKYSATFINFLATEIIGPASAGPAATHMIKHGYNTEDLSVTGANNCTRANYCKALI